MKVTVDPRAVNLTGTISTKEFTIKIGSHIMTILSGLYSNPIDAIVREYLTNMHDAYVALRKKNPNAKIIPPVIHAPSALSPYIEFRDYGIGMSIETVMDVFTQYGNSTKNDSNDEVGGFGIGSKTAFCYNEGSSWTIESRYDGMIHRFMAFVGENSIPQLTLVSSDPTTEHSGVTIKVPIKHTDVPQAIKSIRRYAAFFPMELVVENVPNLIKDTSILTGSDWSVRKMNMVQSMYAVMGNVPYPIDDNEVSYDNCESFIPHQKHYWDSRDQEDEKVKQVLVLNFNVGELDIVPSRDGLKYTDRTVNALAKKMKRVSNEIGPSLEKELEKIPTMWDRARKLTESKGYFSLSNLTLSDKKWSVDSSGQVAYFVENKTMDMIVSPMINATLADNCKNTHRVLVGYAPNDSLNFGTFVVVNDTNQTIKGNRKGNPFGVATAYCRDKFYGKTRKGRIAKYGHRWGTIIYVPTNMKLDDVSTLLGGFPVNRIVRVSDIAQNVTIKALNKKESIYKLRTLGKNFWDARVKIPDTSDTKLYVILHKGYNGRYECQEKVPSMGFESFCSQASLLGYMTYGTPVYGIRSEDEKTFDFSNGWVNLFDSIAKNVEAAILSNLKKYSEYREFKGNFGYDAMHCAWVEKVATQLKKQFPADIVAVGERLIEVKAYERDSKLIGGNQLYECLVGLKKITPIKFLPVHPFDVKQEVKALEKKYPNLPFIRDVLGLSYNSERILANHPTVLKTLL